MWVILAAAFCVNLRFVVFSAHLRPYMMHMPRFKRVISGFVTGDLSYVFFARRYPKPGTTPDELTGQQAYHHRLPIDEAETAKGHTKG